MNIAPMPAPKPALRYLLLPELKEMSPGNPIPNYLKVLLDQDYTAVQDNLGRTALLQADRAARLDKPDWQILLKLKTDGVSLLLPDVQKFRAIAASLQVRFREEIAQGRFDDAITTAKTMFAMSRHMAEHPTLIGELVGVAIAMIAIGPLEEMLQQPGCPNLYWALTNLPHPMIPLDLGLEGERVMIQAELGGLDDTKPMTPNQLKPVIERIDRMRQFETGNLRNKSTRIWLAGHTKDPELVSAARKRLIEHGIREELVSRFPADQVILLDEKREFEDRRDAEFKLLKLPVWEIEKISTLPSPTRDPAFFDFLLSSVYKVRLAQGRLEQRVALLRHVEAIRMYAANHEGHLPRKLDDVEVPLPVDPFTGKSFRYSLEGETAHLRGSPPKGQESVAVYNLHYEITVRK